MEKSFETKSDRW